MDPERERRLNELLLLAFDLPAAERRPFLERSCDGDADLLREAVACLDHESELGDFLETPALQGRSDAVTIESRRTARQRPRPRRQRATADQRIAEQRVAEQRVAEQRVADHAIRVSQIGPYKVIDRLGGGGMGVVYRAEDTRLKRTVAVKFLSDDLEHDVRAKSRFLREAQAAARLDHPNICNIHEIDETDDGRTYMVMACYDGESLKERLDRGPLPLEEAIPIFRQVAAGLAAAHRQGVVHRDIKPANVFLTRNEESHPGRVKVLDFGIAKVTGDVGLTSPGGSIGTPYYMAPEQISGLADHRSDIWSLGVVLYEMVTAKKPFAGPTTINEVLRGPKPALRSERPDFPDFVYRIVERTLEKDPRKRYQSVEELIADLPAPEESSITISKADLAAAMAKSLQPRLLVAAISGLVILIIVVALAVWFQLR